MKDLLTTYLKIYRWAMEMKFRMALYTFTAIFLKAVCILFQGQKSLLVTDLLTMWLTCMVFAMAETAIFPKDCPCTRNRTILWFLLANGCFIGGAVLFDWFPGLASWADALLLIFLELGLFLMWFGDRFVLRMDSAQLTRQLKQYQQRR